MLNLYRNRRRRGNTIDPGHKRRMYKMTQSFCTSGVVPAEEVCLLYSDMAVWIKVLVFTWDNTYPYMLNAIKINVSTCSSSKVVFQNGMLNEENEKNIDW